MTTQFTIKNSAATVSTDEASNMISAAFPLTVTVGKGDNMVTVQVESLSISAILHAMRRGLTEDLNNAKAGLGDDMPEALRRIEAVANKYANADFTRASAGPSGISDDPEVVASQVAREAVSELIKANGGKKSDGSAITKEEKSAAVANYLKANHDAMLTEAKRRIKARKDGAAKASELEGANILKSLGF